MPRSIKTLADINKRRRHTRRVLVYIGIPFVIATVLFSAKVASMSLIANTTVGSYTAQEFTEANQSAERQKLVNIIEGYKAYYNTGTTLIALGSYDSAIGELTTALDMTKDEPKLQCNIRANLAVAYEKTADGKQDDKDAASKLYELAKTTISEADESCRQEGSQSDNSMKDTESRIESKEQEQQDEDTQPPPTPDEQQSQQIEEQINGTAESRQDDEQDREAAKGSPDGKPPVDKPW